MNFPLIQINDDISPEDIEEVDEIDDNHMLEDAGGHVSKIKLRILNVADHGRKTIV